MGTYNQHNATREYSEGNPALPRPGSDKQGRIDIDIQTRKPKKFIILCDGTGQDSSGGTAQNPTNVTRLGRALPPNCWVKKEKGSNTNEQDQAEDDQYEEWEQIVSYHAGVGTFSGNNAFGVIFGNGLSEIVRSAYGFLASNNGFSRGAYIARAIAGLVADHGLLTKRGRVVAFGSGGDHALGIVKHSAIEGILKAQMRFGRVLRPWYAIVPVPVPEQARPLTSGGESA